jgi:carboxymethylenebutenolidase
VPLAIGPVAHLADRLSCPLLGLFGAEDQHPSPEETAELEGILTAARKTFEFRTFEGAGHAFFATNRPNYRPEAALEGWKMIWAFFGRYLAT